MVKLMFWVVLSKVNTLADYLVIAVHVNLCYMAEPAQPLGEVTSTDLEDLKRATEFQKTGSGYALEQGTRPSTLGLVLSSSPLALLAW